MDFLQPSAMAANVMQQMGFSKVKVIDGGMAAWKEAEKQVVIPPKHYRQS